MTPRRFGSVCSGVDAASLAWEPLGWEAAWFAEIDPFASAVLAHRYPEVTNLGDFTKIGSEAGPIDVLVGGTPCQSFSVAGKRLGLDDPRGNLALEFLRLAHRIGAPWLVFENVPGLLSSAGGDDFAAFLSAATGNDIGFPPGGWKNFGVIPQRTSDDYGICYRVLDAQFAGVPQRRRRVFVVGYLGDWRRAAAVLLDRESLSGHPPPRRQAESGVALSVTPGARRASGARSGEQLTVSAPLTTKPWSDRDCRHDRLVADTLKAHHGRMRQDDTYIAHALRDDGFDASEDGTGRGTPIISVTAPTLLGSQGGPSNGYAPIVPVAFTSKDHGQDASADLSPTLRSMAGEHANAGGQVAVAYQCQGSNVGEMGTLRAGNGNETGGVPFVINAAESCAKVDHARRSEVARCLDSTGSFANNQGGTVVKEQMAVRRLTPEECEALQGMPRGWTDVPYRGKPAADGPRYKAIGNSFAVPVVRWIGERIDLVESIFDKNHSSCPSEDRP